MIYIFVDYFPNPYKPYFDTQFSHLVKEGHELKIFAASSYASTINEDVRKYKLDEMVYNFPAEADDVIKYISILFKHVLCNPLRSIRLLFQTKNANLNWKKNLLNYIRAIFLSAREPDICLVHNLGVMSRFTFLKNIYPNSRLGMYFHGGEVGKTPTIKLDKLSFDSVDVVATNTEFSRQQAISRGCDENKINVIPVGFNLADYVFEGQKTYKKNNKLKLVSVGRLSEEKGYVFAIDAIKALIEQGVDNIEYEIVGDGYTRNELKAYIEEQHLTDHIQLSGEKNKEQVSAVLAASDVLILPSLATERWSETQACVVQEAMLMKCIVITTRTGGVPESISPEMEIFSVPPADTNAIVEAVKSINSLSQEKCVELGIAGRQFVENKYDIGIVTPRLLDAIHGH